VAPLMLLIDTHAHLEWPDFDADRDEVLARARAAGVAGILAIGSAAGPDRPDVAIPFAEAHDWIYATIGVHPHESAKAREEHFATLDRLASHPRVIAWGEIGLDYFRDYAPRDVQQRVFRRQLEQALAARLPIVLHCRAAWDDTLRILDEDWRSAGLGGIFHCFSGDLALAQRGIEMGFLISFAANITYPKAAELREVARALPLESIVLETDSPFLPPEGRRGRRNEPAAVAEVARTVASVRDLAPEVVARETTANFRRFFGLTAGSQAGGTAGVAG
jgi:TatD DNase family protein